MHNYPIVTGNRLIRALTKKGYIIVKNKKGKRGKGDHIFIRYPFDSVRSTVVQNISDDLEIGVLNAIRKQLKLSKEEFIDILKECYIMKLLIIGATSFIGPSVLEKILSAFPEQGDIISCLVRTGTDKEKLSKLENLALSHNRKINFTTGDLLSSDSIFNCITDTASPDHSARAYRSDSPARPACADSTAQPDCPDNTDCPDCIIYLVDLRNTTFIRNLLSAVSKTGIKRAVFVSSTSVLVPFEYEMKKAKLKSEQLIQDFAVSNSFDYTILRPTMIYGCADDRNYSKMLNFIKKRGYFVMFGNGQNLIQPVFIEDVAVAVSAVIRNSRTFSKIYTLCGKESIKYKDMLHTVKSLVKNPFKIIRLPLLASKFFVTIYSKIFPKSNLKPDMIERMQVDKAYSYEDAQKDFGFSPIAFRQGIEVLIRKMGL